MSINPDTNNDPYSGQYNQNPPIVGGGAGGPSNIESIDDEDASIEDSDNPYDPESKAYDPSLLIKKQEKGIEVTEASSDSIQPYSPPDDKYV
jgi:hypothetical protein